ncbi:hypothetical protein N007_20145 [Alicyclobacillus acidoterrestris ATCC 49025]|nr:hypothetical protein N007_20145 [Alicyclobacillus acidoterrestris ATCC 49025]
MGVLFKVFKWSAKIDPADPIVQSNIDDIFDFIDMARQAIGW